MKLNRVMKLQPGHVRMVPSGHHFVKHPHQFMRTLLDAAKEGAETTDRILRCFLGHGNPSDFASRRKSILCASDKQLDSVQQLLFERREGVSEEYEHFGRWIVVVERVGIAGVAASLAMCAPLLSHRIHAPTQPCDLVLDAGHVTVKPLLDLSSRCVRLHCGDKLSEPVTKDGKVSLDGGNLALKKLLGEDLIFQVLHLGNVVRSGAGILADHERQKSVAVGVGAG